MGCQKQGMTNAAETAIGKIQEACGAFDRRWSGVGDSFTSIASPSESGFPLHLSPVNWSGNPFLGVQFLSNCTLRDGTNPAFLCFVHPSEFLAGKALQGTESDYFRDTLHRFFRQMRNPVLFAQRLPVIPHIRRRPRLNKPVYRLSTGFDAEPVL